MSLNSILADELRERAVFLARYDATMQKRIVEQLKRLERDITSKLQELDDFGELTVMGRARLEAIISWARSTITNAYKGINDGSVERLIDLAQAEVKHIEKTLNRSVGIQLLDTSVTPAGLSEIVSNTMIRGNPMEDWWAGQSAALGRKFASEMRLGMLAGETLGELVRRVRGTSESGFTDGIMSAATRDAQALVRTAVQTVSNSARMKVYKANEDVVGSLQHLSTLDDRTTDVCKARDGLRWTTEGQPIGHDMSFQTPPLHWNCRSTLIPVTKTWREMGFDADELTPGQRASMDGAVPADQTYEQWLKKKGEAFQNRVLGVEKAQMWRDGEITFKDLVDQTGRELTIEELQDIVTERDMAAMGPLFEGAPAEAEPESFRLLKPNPDAVDYDGDSVTGFKYNGPNQKDIRSAYINEAEAQQRWVARQKAATRDQINEGVNWYTSTGFYPINKTLRTGQYISKGQEDIEKAISGLYTAARPIAKERVVWRGLPNNKRGEGLRSGDQIELSGMVSTTADYLTARQFAKGESTSADFAGVLWEIELPKGTRAINANNGLETEWVLPHGTRLEILRVQQDVQIEFESQRADDQDFEVMELFTSDGPLGRSLRTNYGYIIKARVIETPTKPPPIKDWEPAP